MLNLSVDHTKYSSKGLHCAISLSLISDCKLFDTEKKKDDEILDGIARVLESSHIDNSKSLNILFHENGHQQALFDCLHQNLVCSLYLILSSILKNSIYNIIYCIPNQSS